MSYIGQRPVVGRYIKLDQISSGFNGSNTGFSMTAGSQAVFPGTARNLLLSLGGVIQEPDTDFTISGSTLTFTTPPVANTTFFGVIYGDMQATGTPSDGTVLPASIASSGNFSFPEVTVTGDVNIADSIIHSGDTDTKIRFPAANQISFETTGSEAVRIDESGRLGIGDDNPSQLLTVKGNAPIIRIQENQSGGSKRLDLGVTNSGAVGYIGANQSASSLAFQTTNNERMRITSTGLVGIGLTSPATILHISQTNPELRIQGTNGNGGVHKIFSAGVNSESLQLTGASNLLFNADTQFFRSSDEGTEYMRIDSSGRVGIGDTSPDAPLVVRNASSPHTLFRVNSQSESTKFSVQTVQDSDVRVGTVSNHPLALYSNSLEHMRIGTSGNVYIGQTSGSEQLGVSGGTNAQTLSTNSTNSNGNMVQIKCSGTTKLFLGSAGSFITGNTGTTNQGIRAEGALLFAAGGHSERMRITSDAIFAFTTTVNPGFGTNTDPGHFFADTGYAMHARNAGTALYVSRNVNTGSLVSFNYNGGGQIAEITTNGSSVSYGTGSDYRLKENITTLTNAITRLKNLKPSRFNFLKTPSITQDGFIAHEVQEVVPEAVTGVKDEVLTEDGDMGDKKGDPVMQNLDVAKIVPLLVAALQEEISKRESLETRVAALEAA